MLLEYGNKPVATHTLDRPIWAALTSRQSGFALGGALARRFEPEVGAFVDTLDDSDASLAAMKALVPEDGFVYRLSAQAHPLPPGLVAEVTAMGVQMVADAFEPTPHPPELLRMGEADVSEMLALTALTKPGPFFRRSHELGRYWGIREYGRLAAMAGERLSLDGFTEVSGVCTHPDFQGRGYAAKLSKAVASLIVQRGDQPFLHAYAENAGAIRLYEALGFRWRADVHVAVLRHG